MELSNQLPGSHPLTAPIHPPERVTGPPELHHSEGRYRKLSVDNRWIKLAELIPWDELGEDYASHFCRCFGAPATSFEWLLAL
jgi:hypothetical protein